MRNSAASLPRRLRLSPSPEPSTALLLAFGLVGMAVGGRQRGL
ncbi:MAG: PEP-CTERM sorting domain-containing protein [Planctomycetota bacterium]